MKQLGLIGYPLEHSFSPFFFKRFFEENNITNYDYNLFPIEHIELLPKLLNSNKNIVGLNVTIPYKELVTPFLHSISDDAKNVGAVNTIVINKDKKLFGFNTDVIGFEKSLLPLLSAKHTKALILGTGGASKAVKFVLKKLNIDYTFVTKKSITQKNTINYTDLNADLIAECKLIINTTPLGMFPNTESYPEITYKSIGKEHLLYDLVYNPTQTLFLIKGKNQGSKTKNGLEMLELQAKASWELFKL